MLVALAGGVGAAKFLRGLLRVHDPADLVVVGNTGDDLRMHGLAVSPDLDSVAYTLAGLADEERGWGLAGETWNVREALVRLGEPGWFALGDRDIATHLLRTRMLHQGASLSAATAELCRRLGVPVPLLPMSDQRVETRVEVDGPDGPLDLGFQEYWVGRQARDPVRAVRFQGIEDARPAPGVLEALAGAGGVLLCPSNPVVSIAPILAVPGIRDAVAAARLPGGRRDPDRRRGAGPGHGRQAAARLGGRGVGPRGGRAVRRPGRRLRARHRRRRAGRRRGRPGPGAGGGEHPDADRRGRRRARQGGLGRSPEVN